MTKIEWTHIPGYTPETWNPVTGCTHAGSPGCDHCYARTMSRRLQAMGVEKYREGWEVMFHPAEVERPVGWRKPRAIFVCSMSDLFHECLHPKEVVWELYEVMGFCRQHLFIVCTKRPERIVPVLYKVPSHYFGGGDYQPNIWHLTTVESQLWADKRIPPLLELRKVGVGWGVLGLSCEPLLGPLDLRPWLDRLDWVIVGGESGPKARPMNVEWARSIRDQCAEAGVAFFMKQMSGRTAKARHDIPPDVRVRQFPEV